MQRGGIKTSRLYFIWIYALAYFRLSRPPLSAAPPDGPTVVRGILYALIGVGFFAVMAALAKIATESYSVVEVVFFRNLFGIIPPLFILVSTQQWDLLRTNHLAGHFWRGTLGIASMALIFTSVSMLPLADYTAISFTAPLFVTALSGIVLGERVGLHRWGAVIAGFIGILIICHPTGDFFSLGVIAAIASAFLVAIISLLLRQLGKTENPTTTVLYFSIISMLYSLIPLPFFWETPNLAGFALLASVGIVGGFGQHFITRAYVMAPVAVIAPFSYASIIWASLLGWLIWDDFPTLYVLAGSLVVISSGLFILYQETRRKNKTPS